VANDLTSLLCLGDDDLRNLAAALRSGRLASPFRSIGLQRIVPATNSDSLQQELQWLHEQGFSGLHIAALIEALVKDRAQRPRAEDIFDLVTTGPESPGTSNRDTSVVVRELFANAEVSVLIAGYAVYQGRRVFKTLADTMIMKPELKVQMVLDVRRGPGDSSESTEIVQRFRHHFGHQDWPPDRPIPELFYFPPSLEDRPQDRGAMHAKLIVIDQSKVFISSANFTEAAQERNIEVGLVIRSRLLAAQISKHFASLISDGTLKPILG
jgi:hypothetical protein